MEEQKQNMTGFPAQSTDKGKNRDAEYMWYKWDDKHLRWLGFEAGADNKDGEHWWVQETQRTKPN